MKKNIMILLGFVLCAFAITACNPVDSTLKDLRAQQAATPKTVNYTLLAADYTKWLSSKSTPYKTTSFVSADTAKAYIPTILNGKFFDYANGSIANITYTSSPVTVKLADSTYNNLTYTVTTDDYTASEKITGTTYKDYSDDQVLLFLTYKYPNPVANQLSLLTYNWFLSGVTPNAGIVTTDSFLFLNGTWTKLYTVTAAQYTALGRGNYGNFTVADNASLPGWFNSMLKADQVVSATAKAGDVKYISYKYYNSSNKTNYQRVLALTFDGTNWVTKPTTFNTLTFVKKDGKWVPDNTIYYQLVSDDYVNISKGTIGSDAARSNLGQFKNFNITAGGTTTWKDDEINQAVAAYLKTKYTSPADGQVFKITIYVYNSGVYSYPVKTFVYTGGAFVLQ